MPNSIHYEYAVVSDNGLRNSYTVDFALVNSKAYHDKFDGLTGRKAVDEAIYKKATEFLSHRGGTPYEDIAMLDSRTGAVLAENTTARGLFTFRSGITDTQYNRLLAMGKRFEILHNHPGSTPPSVADLRKMFERPLADASTVIAHNGKVYRMEKLKPYDMIERFAQDMQDNYINANIPKELLDRHIFSAMIEALEDGGYIKFLER